MFTPASFHPPVPLQFFPNFSSPLSLSPCTYTRGVIALSRGERGHPWGRTNVQNRAYRIVSVKESRGMVGVCVGGGGWGASITLIILPHLERLRDEWWGKSLSWLLVNLKRNFIFQSLVLSFQSIYTITRDISVIY